MQGTTIGSSSFLNSCFKKLIDGNAGATVSGLHGEGEVNIFGSIHLIREKVEAKRSFVEALIW